MATTNQSSIWPVRRILSFACAIGLMGVGVVGSILIWIGTGAGFLEKSILTGLMIAVGVYWLWKYFIKERLIGR